ncbi:fibronectin type III domain-containing protein [Candidatus Halobeggiatoa sp. HSG11]|nr:fibronectin type III domain-containing protein [Candidatus Halobeggiatoa sp. HSG11]
MSIKNHKITYIFKQITLIILINMAVLPVYAALTINPVNLSVDRVQNGSYSLVLDSLLTKHRVTYCFDGFIEQNFYYKITLDDGMTWGNALTSSSLSVKNSIVKGGSVNGNTVTFLIDPNDIPIDTCLNFGAEITLNIPQSELGDNFQVATTITNAEATPYLLEPEYYADLVKITNLCSTVTEIPQNECNTLVKLYNNTSGNNWADSYDNYWNLTNIPCSWYGVSCEGGHVTVIERSNKNLTGSLPDLSALAELKTLNLSSNKLTGNISDLTNLDNLLNLHLENNQLNGSIPDSIKYLTKLTKLNLKNNNLQGEFPFFITNILTDDLQLLDLGYNKLATEDDYLRGLLKDKDPDWEATQTVPPIKTTVVATSKSPTSIEITWEPIDYTADIGYYQIKYSTVSGSYDKTKKTESKNDGSITIGGLSPATPYYFKIETITEIHDEQQNRLVSESEEYQVKTLETATINVLDANNNIIDGSFEFGEVMLDDTVSETFTIEIVDGSFVNLWSLEVTNEDNLEVINEKVFDIKGEFETGIITIDKDDSTNNKEFTTFTINVNTTYANTFKGEVSFQSSSQDKIHSFSIIAIVKPNEIIATDCTQTDITGISETECLTLLKFYATTDGENWNNNDKWNQTNSPCEWYGITCTTDSTTELTHVTKIELADNNLTGFIPDLSLLEKLQTLNLSYNQLSDEIPLSFIDLADLNYNRLTTQNPNWNTTQTIPPKIEIVSESQTSVTLQWETIPYRFASGNYTIQHATTSGGPYESIDEIILVENNEPEKVNQTEISEAYLSPDINHYFVMTTYTDNLEGYISTSEYSLEVVKKATTLPDKFSEPEPDSYLDMYSSELGTPSTTVSVTILKQNIDDPKVKIIEDEKQEFSYSKDFNIVTVQCTPVEVGPRTATLEISYSIGEDISETHQYTLVCEGEDSHYNSKPKPTKPDEEPIDIGTTKIEEAITTTLTIFNYEGLEITGYDITSEYESDFSINELVQNEASDYELTITCRPTNVGEWKAKLEVFIEDPLPSKKVYDFICTGEADKTGPIYEAIPKTTGTLNNGTLNVGNAIFEHEVTNSIIISNSGDDILVIETSDITEDVDKVFSIIKGKIEEPISIVPINDETEEKTHELVIQCIPKLAEHTAILTVTTNIKKEQSYKLICTGEADKTGPIYDSVPKPTKILNNEILNDGILNVGNTVLGGSPATNFIAISNTGDNVLNIETSEITKDINEVFSIIEGKAPFSIDAKTNEEYKTHKLKIQCIPKLGEHTATLTITIPESEPIIYTLKCTGIEIVIPPPTEVFKANGEIQTQAGLFGNNHSINASEKFKLTGTIEPATQHIGENADIIVIYYWKAFGSESSIAFPAITVGTQVQLQKEMEGTLLFEGTVLNMTGIFEVEFGYRTSDNEYFTDKIATLTIESNKSPTGIILELNDSDKDNMIGTFSTEDEDKEDEFIYSLINPNGYFKIIDDELHVTDFIPQFEEVKIVTDANLEDTYPINIQTTDSSGGFFQKNFIIQITPVTETPLIYLTRKSVSENYQGVVGRIWTDESDYKFELLENDYFELDDSGILRLKQPLDFETNPSHEITVNNIAFEIKVDNMPDATVHGKLFDKVEDFIKVINLREVSIQLIPDIEHQFNFEANILAVAIQEIDKQVNAFILNSGIWQNWDGLKLPEFNITSSVLLEEQHELELFESMILPFTKGNLQIYAGYRLENGQLIYDLKPVVIEVQ